MTEKEQIEQVLAEKRHNEITKGHGDIVETLGKVIAAAEKDTTKPIVDAVGKQTNAINEFTNAIKSLPKPEVNVELNPHEIVSSLSEMTKAILQGQQEVVTALSLLIEKQSELKEWEFKVDREFNRITKVKATQIK